MTKEDTTAFIYSLICIQEAPRLTISPSLEKSSTTPGVFSPFEDLSQIQDISPQPAPPPCRTSMQKPHAANKAGLRHQRMRNIAEPTSELGHNIENSAQQ